MRGEPCSDVGSHALQQVGDSRRRGERRQTDRRVIEEDVEHHVEEEEGEMFPDARKYLRDKLEDLGA